MPWPTDTRQCNGLVDIHNLAPLDPWQALERVEQGGGARMVSRCIALVYYFKALLANSANDHNEVYNHIERALGYDWHIRIAVRSDAHFSTLKNDLQWKSLLSWK